MAITDYTSYAEVRSACGLSTDDLPDETLALEMYSNVLDIKLGEVVLPDTPPGPGDLPTRFAEIKALPESSRSALEQKLYNLTRLYATYAVAVEVAVSLSMRAAKSISDSKTTLVRFSPESTYELVIDKLNDLLSAAKEGIENIADPGADISGYSSEYLSVVSPERDIVTGAYNK